MGREIKRVPLDFQWPTNKIWDGYRNPHYRRCPKAATAECLNGSTGADMWLLAFCRLVNLAIDDPNHPWITALPIALDVGENRMAQGPEFGALIERLIDMSGIERGGAGRMWLLFQALKAFAGVPEGWGTCPVCNGTGMDPAAAEAYEAWRRTDPPTGEGWQLWETVSEGSPISPVFARAEALIGWMCEPDAKIRTIAWAQGYQRAHAEALVLGSGWAPSLAASDGRAVSGVEAAALLGAKQ